MRQKEIYYKELDHVIMEAGKAKDPQLASWRSRRASGVSSSPKAGSFKTQEESMFKSKAEGPKRPMSQFNRSGRRISLLPRLFVLFRSSVD